MKRLLPIIRDFEVGDFHAVQQLWVDTGMGSLQRNDDLHTIQKTLDLGGKLFILEESEFPKIIGTSWLTQDGRRIYLHHFGILPEFQGKGLASLLLKSSLDFARSTGLQIKLEVHKSNELATQIYTKGGFKYLGDYLVYIIRDYSTIPVL